jgi:hypothetical protein
MKETLQVAAILLIASMILFGIAVVFASHSPDHSEVEYK